ncbi:MAG TPA: transcriptional regulator [Polyangiaceae bacterium]|nr:transcriptional regulator [Polyangiaceae bacterium]
MDIKLITSDKDYEEALAEIERLWDARADSADEATLELLAMLVHNYERSRWPLPTLDPVEAIEFRMDQQGLTRKDLLPVFGTSARTSEVLSGKRKLTLDMIRKLHERFGIPLESLIGPTEAPRRKRRRAKRRGAPRAGASARGAR